MIRAPSIADILAAEQHAALLDAVRVLRRAMSHDNLRIASRGAMAFLRLEMCRMRHGYGSAFAFYDDEDDSPHLDLAVPAGADARPHGFAEVLAAERHVAVVAADLDLLPGPLDRAARRSPAPPSSPCGRRRRSSSTRPACPPTPASRALPGKSSPRKSVRRP